MKITMSYAHYPDYTFVSKDESTHHPGGEDSYAKLGQQQSIRGGHSFCVVQPSLTHGGSYIRAPKFEYPISISSVVAPKMPSKHGWQPPSSVLPLPDQVSSTQLDFNVGVSTPISSNSSGPARYHSNFFPRGPIDKWEAESLWETSIGQQLASSLPSNVSSVDIDQQGKSALEIDPLLRSHFQNDPINGPLSAGEEFNIGYFNQLTLRGPYSPLGDPFQALPPAADSNHQLTDQITWNHDSQAHIPDCLPPLVASKILYDSSWQSADPSRAPADPIPPLLPHLNPEFEDVVSLSLSSVQQQPVAFPPNSTESEPNVTDSLDWLIDPEKAREILSKDSVAIEGQQPIFSQSTKAKPQHWLAGDTNLVQDIWVEGTRVTSLDASTFSPLILTPMPTNPLPVLPPPADLTHYSIKQRGCLAVAFTKDSCHPSIALRSLLDYVLPSAFILDQSHEPFFTDKLAMLFIERIIHLPQCPPIDFGNSKRSLFTIFVEKAAFRCLFCGLCKTSMPRALGCVRSHLGHKPFRCSGCQSCNQVDGYAKFGTSALLKDHLSGQIKKMKCGACGVELRRDGMRRHWNSMHKQMPFPFHEHPRYRRLTVGSKQTVTSVSASSEDAEGLLDYM